MERLVYIADEPLAEQDMFCDNRISNRKYTILNFLPKNLWEQFGRFMNQYFLLIACLQLWPLITPVNPASTWGPLIFIFTVSATKEAWDDYSRYVLDKQANERAVWIVSRGVKKQIKAQDIKVGDIVWIRENDEIPCDLVLVGTSDPHGLCYIETAALDGETDLKTRHVPSGCAGVNVQLLHKIKGVIECPIPDKDIRRFDANIRLFPPFIDNEFCPLTINNTILQSCYLRNTEWACGIAVYTGNETKLGMSRGMPEPKLTAVDAMIDKLTGAIFAFQIVIVIVLGIYGNIWKETEARKQWYVSYASEGPWYELLVIPLRFELLCSIMIPISIKVSLDLVKGLYAKFIDWDMEMYDEETGTSAHAANTAISEDLGQVEYILTDKTGTLTENKMVFRRCFINRTFYGSDNGNALKDTRFLNAIANGSPDVTQFLTIMAICNTVIPVRSQRRAILYKAQSQDEEALVRAASELDMCFVDRNGNLLAIKHNGALIHFELLETLEFTSDRKRMSVVVKDCRSEEIFLLSKGADEAILPFSFVGQKTKAFYEAEEHFSQLGLRTLCLAWRKLTQEEYSQWHLQFKEAQSSLVDREWRTAEVCQRLELDLEVLGVTAIEDSLQADVPETIETLRKAGINFWMLTGDKQNTAIQIARSCSLVSPEPNGQFLVIDGKTKNEVYKSLERVLLTMRITSLESKDVAFVVDGWALEILLEHYVQAFAELSTLSKTAICCRVTPSQKAQVVELIKSCGYRTLAIGDGGNDVRMIQKADIGVGISGREGLQAARAADYSIGKFRYLKRLILIHGRYSYNRTTFLSQYSFYKSLLICFIQIFFSFISGFSGTSLFDSVSLMAYNVAYTSIPVLVNVLDKDLCEETVIQHPHIFRISQAGRLLNPTSFAGWFGRSLFHASVVFVITIHTYGGNTSDLDEVAMVALSGCIWLQAFLVTLETNSITLLQFLAIWINFAGFYAINWILSAVPQSRMYTIMFKLCRQPSYWITMLLIVAAGMAPLLALKYFRYTYTSSELNMVRQSEIQWRGRPIYSLGSLRSKEKAVGSMPLTQTITKTSISEPLLEDATSAKQSHSRIGSRRTGNLERFLPSPIASFSRKCCGGIGWQLGGRLPKASS